MKAKVKVKKSNLGGHRTPNKLSLATQRLLKILWEIYGGPRELGRISDMSPQKFIHWRNAGKVSFNCIGKLSRKLKLPIQAFNFEEVGEVLGYDLFDWEQLLRQCGLTVNQTKYVNQGVLPKEFKDEAEDT